MHPGAWHCIPCCDRLLTAGTRDLTLDTMLLHYVMTSKALDAAKLPRILRAAGWLHINALGGLWTIHRDQGQQWRVPPIMEQ